MHANSFVPKMQLKCLCDSSDVLQIYLETLSLFQHCIAGQATIAFHPSGDWFQV